jgi:hypothetical protein
MQAEIACNIGKFGQTQGIWFETRSFTVTAIQKELCVSNDFQTNT